jgi:hypothetical protein
MLLREIKELSSDQIAELRKQLLKNLKAFCKSTFHKPVDVVCKNEHIYAKHHTNEQIEFDLWLHTDSVFLDNFFLDESLKNHGFGTQFVEVLVASLPDEMSIKVRDHSAVGGDIVGMSDTFWMKMKAKHDDRQWIIVR